MEKGDIKAPKRIQYILSALISHNGAVSDVLSKVVDAASSSKSLISSKSLSGPICKDSISAPVKLIVLILLSVNGSFVI